MKKLFFIIILIIVLVPATKATHIVGGELNYLYLGNDNYQITLTVYRDCENGIPPFDPFAAVGIFDANHVLLDTLLMSFRGSDTLDPTLSSPCIIPPPDVCYEVTTYIDTINLPPILGGYQLAYQRCCRNQTILNIVAPGATGATYYATIPDTNVVLINSNPVFREFPPTFICSQLPFSFDHSATDPDGDSLYYELFQPFHGGDNVVCNPPVPASQPCGPMPQPPFNPPYINITWQAPYSTSDMLGTALPLSVPLTIHPNTGLLTAVPDLIGQYVIGIKVSEYRNGVFLSETKRDYQFNVLPCEKITIAALITPEFSCESFTATFINESDSAASFLWNFGDLTVTNDTSSLETPSYTYADTGVYIVTLIAFSDLDPSCNDTAFGVVIILPEFELTMASTLETCTQNVAFTSSTLLDSTSSVIYDWDFGDPTILSDTSNLMNPVFTYPNPGTYTVTLIAYSPNNTGCNDTNTIIVTIFPEFNLNASLVDNPCSPDVNFLGNSSYDGIFNVNYFWDFGDPAIQTDTTSSPNLTYTFPNTGTFNPVLIAYSNNPACSDTIQLSVTIYPEFISTMAFTNEPCTQDVVFTASTSLDGIATVIYDWNFGDLNITTDTSNLINPNYTYQDSGTYIVTFISYSPFLNGCSDTSTLIVPIFLGFDLNASLMIDPCSPNVNFIGNSSYDNLFNVNYFWDFGDSTILSDTANIANSSYTYSNTGAFNPVLIAFTENPVCDDTIQLSVMIYPEFTTDFGTEDIRCTFETIFKANSSLDGLVTTNYNWDFGDSENSTLPIDTHLYAGSGDYLITLTINTENGCSEIYTTSINKFDLSAIFIPNAFTPNGDNENDVLFVRGTFDEMSIKIYDRWGEKVFESDNQSIGWDGTYKGNLVDPRVFVYHLTTKCSDNDEIFKKGNVTVIR